MQCPFQFMNRMSDNPDFDNEDPELKPPVARKIPVLPKVPPKSKKNTSSHKNRHRGNQNRRKLYHGPPKLPKAIQKELDDIFKPKVAPPKGVPPLPPPVIPPPIPVPVGFKGVPTNEPEDSPIERELAKTQKGVYERWLTKGRLADDLPRSLEKAAGSDGTSATDFNADPPDSNSQLPPPRTQESISRMGEAESRLANSLARQRHSFGVKERAPVRIPSNSGAGGSRLPFGAAVATAAMVAGGVGLIGRGLRTRSRKAGSGRMSSSRVGISGGGGIGRHTRETLRTTDFGRFAF